MYKNNSGLIAKTKVSNYKKGQCLTEKLVPKNPLLLIPTDDVAFAYGDQNCYTAKAVPALLVMLHHRRAISITYSRLNLKKFTTLLIRRYGVVNATYQALYVIGCYFFVLNN